VQPSSPVPCQLTGSSTYAYYSCFFSITAVGGSVSYTLSEPSSESDYQMDIQNATGTLPAGQQQGITVSVTWYELQNDTAYITMDPGGTMVQFSLPPCTTCP